MRSMLNDALFIARKDLLIELRARTAFLSALVFSLLAAVIFFFAWDQTGVASIDLAPGVVWVIFTFAGLLGLHRSFRTEHDDRALDALLAAPVDREAIFLGKALANLGFVLGVQLVTVPVVALFYNLPPSIPWLALGGVILLAAVGFVVVGTLFSSMAANTRLAELLLPVLALPFFVPVVMAAAQVTAKLFAGRPASEAMSWLKLLMAFDMVFLVLCTLAYPYTIEE